MVENLSVSSFLSLSLILMPRIGHHFHHRRADFGERHVAAGDRQGGGIENQIGEP
jgi:hypothetical protein